MFLLFLSRHVAYFFGCFAVLISELPRMFNHWAPIKWKFMPCFQLRNLLWATSKHDVYLMQNYSVMHWSSLLHKAKEVLNVYRPIQSTLVSSFILIFYPVVTSYYDMFWQRSGLSTEVSSWISGSNHVKGLYKHYGCEGQSNGGWWLPGRTYLQGSNTVIHYFVKEQK